MIEKDEGYEASAAFLRKTFLESEQNNGATEGRTEALTPAARGRQ